MRDQPQLRGTIAKGLVRGLLVLAAPIASAESPPIEDLLRKAGEHTVKLQDQLAVTIAREDYDQGLWSAVDRKPRTRRTIVSDVVWVPTGDAMVWAFFRDVLSVDGAPVTDRVGRLEELFSAGTTLDARQSAGRLLEEGARYNLGVRRTVNTPAFCLAVLHPKNQGRFRFRTDGEERINGVSLQKVRFSEVSRPTLTRTSMGTDVPARGLLLIEPEQGALVATELKLEALGTWAQIEVRYQPQGEQMVWLPVEMREVYSYRSGPVGNSKVEATARYSSFRGAQVEIKPFEVVR